MRRLRRIILGLLTLASLIVCLGTIALWIRSYSGSDYVMRRWMIQADRMSIVHDGQSIEWTRGQIRFQLLNDTYYPNGYGEVTMTVENSRPDWSVGRLGPRHVYWESPPPRSVWNRLGFMTWQNGWSSSFADSGRKVYAIPAWSIALLTAISPVVWLRRKLRQRRRYGHGLCPKCGYDLRATPDRCPECGASTSDDSATVSPRVSGLP
jgi:hypothetical protein